MVVVLRDYMLEELYDAKLWTYMGWYGLVFVFGGQVSWLMALTSATPLSISVGTTTLFVLTIVWGIAILQKIPSKEEWIGVSVISLSILSSIMEKLSNKKVIDDSYLPLSANDHGIKTELLDENASSDLHASLLQQQNNDHFDDDMIARDRHTSVPDLFNRLSTASVDSISVFGGFKGF
jgi:hypothetical protein